MLGQNPVIRFQSLSAEQRTLFDIITWRMEEAGLDLSRLRLSSAPNSVRPNQLRFKNDPWGLAHLRQQLKAGVRRGQYYVDKPFELFHRGLSEFGVRENRPTWTLQYGFGKNGAFVDLDRFNYKAGAFGYLAHTAEVMFPGKPSEAALLDYLDVPRRPAPRTARPTRQGVFGWLEKYGFLGSEAPPFLPGDR